GVVKVAVATASLELGIDVGAIDLVVQVGSPRAIATLLQRVGRSGHSLGATPRGRLFALTRDQLMECAALVRGVRGGNLDQIELRDAPLDILAQQIVAISAAEELPEHELVELIRGATPYAQISDERIEQLMVMLSEGVSDRRGRVGAYVHRDRVGGMLRARRSARLAAITSGGAIPDNNNYTVVQWPEETQVGSVDEDFAIDSSAGDVFQLGNTSWRIRRIEAGRVLVEDARGQPPTIPFWFGEAPARTRELSDEVSSLRGEIDRRLTGGENPDDLAVWLATETSMPLRAAQQAVAYLAASRTALGALPRNNLIIAERFFDEGGGMQLVIHAPLGGRINRAWGLALRKKFCVTFDFELQAIATDDGIVISLGQPHSFPLDTVFGYVPSHQAQETLVQALLDRPMFEIRWRWNVTRSLTVLRRRAGKRVPPHLVKMRAADTLSVVFPQAVACGENITGPREVPDHPLVFETVRDCLVEAMDIEGFRGMLEQLESGEIQVLARDTVEPSPLSHELLNANPYAFLDDAPLEERRTRAVQLRRGLPAAITQAGEESVGALDEAAIALASEEVAPTVRDADELHDALLALWLVPERMGESLAAGSRDWFAALTATGRGCRLRWRPRPGDRGECASASPPWAEGAPCGEADGIVHAAWVATERLGAARALLGDDVEATPMIATPSWAAKPAREEALGKVVSAHLDHRGPVSTRALAAELGLPLADVLGALLALEGDGAILRGSFTAATALAIKTVKQALASADDTDALVDTEWCNRRVLARIHRLTLARLRREIEPVSAAALMRFLLRWQRVGRNTQLIGADGLARVVEQLQGFETAAGAWEREILPSRLYGYEQSWLDQMCLAGAVVWCRLSPRKCEAVEHEQPLSAEEATKLLAALTQVAASRAGIDAFPPILHSAIKAGERAATKAVAKKKQFGGSTVNDRPGAARKQVAAWLAPRSAEPANDESWIAPVAPDEPALRDPAIAIVIDAVMAAAQDASASRNQTAAAVAGVLCRAFPALPELNVAMLALESVFPQTPQRRNAPSRSAPLALLLRRDATWLRAAAAVTAGEPAALSPLATRIRDHLQTYGASFLSDLVAGVDTGPDAVEDALWELVGAGVATADGFASLRVLVDRRRGEVKSHFDRHASPYSTAIAAGATPLPAAPVRKWQDAIRKARTRDRERPSHALRSLPTAAGRWSLLPPAKPEALDAEASARQLLLRYGVVFRDLLARESSLPPWRDLLVALRRLEARGEIRGGRFVTGFGGEQFALPEALDELRAARSPGPVAEVSRVAATDPLNLVGVLSPGPRVPAIVGNAVLYVDGQAVASLESGELVRRAPPPQGARIDDDLTYHPPPRPVPVASQAALPL
ncbi:MAG TPA: helicase-related protein, partial [Kofleriaceae bacterium]